jgi:hypothetical protein
LRTCSGQGQGGDRGGLDNEFHNLPFYL